MSQALNYGLVSVILSSSGHDMSVGMVVATHIHRGSYGLAPTP